MIELTARAALVVGGVDTHKDTHTAAALDETGRSLGTAEFSACSTGYTKLLAWLRAFGPIDRVGIEGTGPMALVSRPTCAQRACASSR